jgi:dihydrofolate reductase
MNVIVAVNGDWGIGYNGAQTIIIPEDRRYFRKVTDGGVVIAGRKTFTDIQRPLPNRKNIVLTRDARFKAEGAVVTRSVGEVLSEISGDDPDTVFVIGGGSIYELFLPLCARAYVTKIEATPLSDTFFPNLDALPEWSLESEFKIQNSNYNDTVGAGISYSFCLYKNNNAAAPEQLTTDH